VPVPGVSRCLAGKVAIFHAKVRLHAEAIVSIGYARTLGENGVFPTAGSKRRTGGQFDY
jgi:hypothetical protein